MLRVNRRLYSHYVLDKHTESYYTLQMLHDD